MIFLNITRNFMILMKTSIFEKSKLGVNSHATRGLVYANDSFPEVSLPCDKTKYKSFVKNHENRYKIDKNDVKKQFFVNIAINRWRYDCLLAVS